MVKHGVNGWIGIVSSVSPGALIVDYPQGSEPGDSIPAREHVSLSMRKVTVLS